MNFNHHYTLCSHCNETTKTFGNHCLVCGGEKNGHIFNGPITMQGNLTKRHSLWSLIILSAMSMVVLITFIYIVLIHHHHIK